MLLRRCRIQCLRIVPRGASGSPVPGISPHSPRATPPWQIQTSSAHWFRAINCSTSKAPSSKGLPFHPNCGATPLRCPFSRTKPRRLRRSIEGSEGQLGDPPINAALLEEDGLGCRGWGAEVIALETDSYWILSGPVYENPKQGSCGAGELQFHIACGGNSAGVVLDQLVRSLADAESQTRDRSSR
jgi:hypothetical protein